MKRIFQTLSQKWPEYILEIFVLIIGIYGAFELERWNEEVSANKKEKVLLKAIHEEFIANNERLEKATRSHQQVLKSTRWLIENAPFNESSNIDSIRYHFRLSFTTATFNPSSSSIAAIINTGSLEIVRNEELRSLLVGWADISQGYKEEETLAKNFQWNEYLTTWRDYIDFKVFDPRQNFDFDYRVLNRREISNLIRQRSFYFKMILTDGELQEIKRAINRIIQLTEIEK